MSTAERTPRAREADPGLVLWNGGWDGYEKLLRATGRARITYARGNAEILSPGLSREVFGRLLDRFIEIVAEESGFPIFAAGAPTFRKRLLDRGIEPDACFYLGDAAERARRLERIDELDGPPPSLAIEVEITRTVLSRLDVYAALGFPEIWRFDGKSIEVLSLVGTQYLATPGSPAFPWLDLRRVESLVVEGRFSETSAWAARARAWIGTQVPR